MIARIPTSWLWLLAHVAVLATLLVFLHHDLPAVDLMISDHYFHPVPAGVDPHNGWLLPKTDARLSFWLHAFINRAELCLSVICIVALAWSCVTGRYKHWRMGLAAIVFCFALGPGSVAFLKQHTLRYCPSQLSRYGGPVPMIDVVGGRLPDLPKPNCWPAAHPAGGFALMALAFLPGWRWRGLVIGVGAGVALGWVQVARGEHFASHVLATFLILLFVMHLWKTISAYMQRNA